MVIRLLRRFCEFLLSFWRKIFNILHARPAQPYPHDIEGGDAIREVGTRTSGQVDAQSTTITQVFPVSVVVHSPVSTLRLNKDLPIPPASESQPIVTAFTAQSPPMRSKRQRPVFPRPLYLTKKFFKPNNVNISQPTLTLTTPVTSLIRPEIFIEDWSGHTSGLGFSVSELHADESPRRNSPSSSSNSSAHQSSLFSRLDIFDLGRQRRSSEASMETESRTLHDSRSVTKRAEGEKAIHARPTSKRSPLAQLNLNLANKYSSCNDQGEPATPISATPSSRATSPEPVTPLNAIFSTETTTMRAKSKKAYDKEPKIFSEESPAIAISDSPSEMPITIPIPTYTVTSPTNFPSPAFSSLYFEYSSQSYYEDNQPHLSEPDVPDLARVHEVYSFAPIQYHSNPLSALTLDGIWDTNPVVESESCLDGSVFSCDTNGVQMISLPLPALTSTPPRSRAFGRTSAIRGSQSTARETGSGPFIQFSFEDLLKYYQSSRSTDSSTKGPKSSASISGRGLTLRTKFLDAFSSSPSPRKNSPLKHSSSVLSSISVSASASIAESLAVPASSNAHTCLSSAPSDVAVIVPTALRSSSSLPSIASNKAIYQERVSWSKSRPGRNKSSISAVSQFATPSPSSYLFNLALSASGSRADTQLKKRRRDQTVVLASPAGPSATSTPIRRLNVDSNNPSPAWCSSSPSIDGPLKEESSPPYLALGRKSTKRGVEGRHSPPPELNLTIGPDDREALRRIDHRNIRASLVRKLQDISHTIDNSDEWELVSLEEIGKRLIEACQDRSRGSWTQEEFLRIVEG